MSYWGVTSFGQRLILTLMTSAGGNVSGGRKCHGRVKKLRRPETGRVTMSAEGENVTGGRKCQR